MRCRVLVTPAALSGVLLLPMSGGDPDRAFIIFKRVSRRLRTDVILRTVTGVIHQQSAKHGVRMT
jgi:hypothetical protein